MVSPAVSLPHSSIAIPDIHEPAPRARAASKVNVGQVERVVSIMLGSLLVAKGIKSFSLTGLGIAGAGAALIHRGSTGQCSLYKSLGVTSQDASDGSMPLNKALSHPFHQTIRVEKTITVNKPAEEVYAFWRKLENLPRFMDHLESVTEVDAKRSHWIATGPRGKRIEWNADIISDEPNKRIAWKSVEGADVANAGQVIFEAAPGGAGTTVKVILAYDPPAGVFGALFAKLFGEEPNQTVAEDLRHFKQILETGETPTTDGQPKGSSK